MDPPKNPKSVFFSESGGRGGTLFLRYEQKSPDLSELELDKKSWKFEDFSLSILEVTIKKKITLFFFLAVYLF